MIVVRLKGGLGNQMFQYAFGKHLANQSGCEIRLETGALLDRSPKSVPGTVFRDYDLDVFQLKAMHLIPLNLSRLVGRFGKQRIRQWMFNYAAKGREYIRENQLGFDLDLYTKSPSNCFLDGYWQSWRYFDDIAVSLRKEFKFRRPMGAAGSALKAQIESRNSVSINIRRTDFLTSGFHATLDLEYYLRAVAVINEKVVKPVFYVFTDDHAWCREHLNLPVPFTVVDESYNGFKYSGKLELMTACRHAIISNSTFAWWAAWLGNHPEKIVIAPQQWFKAVQGLEDKLGMSVSPDYVRDITPAEWMTV